MKLFTKQSMEQKSESENQYQNLGSEMSKIPSLIFKIPEYVKPDREEGVDIKEPKKFEFLKQTPND